MSVTPRSVRPRRDHPTGRPSTVGVLDRVVAVIEAIDGGARSFTDVVDATGLTRSTTHRLLKALDGHDLVMHVDGVGYRLGPRLLRLAAAASRDLPLRDLAHPILERLALATGESAQLFLRDGDRRVCVDAVESESELRTIIDVGSELPLTAGSAGKIFIAWAPRADRERLIEAATTLTRSTPTGDRLAREVRGARRRGFAASAGERHPGVGSVSAPVLDSNGGLVAVVSVSGPESRLGRTAAARYAPAVTDTAREIEHALGFTS